MIKNIFSIPHFAVMFFWICCHPGFGFSAGSEVQNVTFIDQTKTLGFEDKYDNYGIAFLDINKDGYYDLYVNNHTFRDTFIYINLEGKKFQKINAVQFGIRRGGDKHGAAASDINNDGWTDIYQVIGGRRGLGKGGQHNFLYIYDQNRKKFRDMTVRLLARDPFGRGRGAAVVDYSKNGLPDIFVSNQQSSFNDFSKNKLYRQMPDGKFIEVSKPLNLSFSAKTFAWHDFDNDGYQDLYIDKSNSIYWNIKGDHFSSKQNVARRENPWSSYSVKVVLDAENDGFLDFFYFDPRYPRSEDSCFTDEVGDLVIHMAMRKYHVDRDKVRVYTDSRDIDILYLEHRNVVKPTKDTPANPGLKLYVGKEKMLKIHRKPIKTLSLVNITPGTPPMDEDGIYIFVDESGYLNIVGRGRRVKNVNESFDLILRSKRPFTKLTTEGLELTPGAKKPPLNFYLKNPGKKQFVQKTLKVKGAHNDLYGIINGTPGDFNNDGFMDIFLAGAKMYEGNDFLLLNDGHGGFLSNPLPTYSSRRGRKAVYVWDLNNDGLLDVFIAESMHITKGRHTVLKNVTKTGNQWIEIVLRGSGKTSRDAIGTRVELHTPRGVQVREVGEMIGENMSVLPLHFGLGKEGIVSKVLVYWNSGVKEIKGTDLKINTRNLIVE
jgi:hypothetical protein